MGLEIRIYRFYMLCVFQFGTYHFYPPGGGLLGGGGAPHRWWVGVDFRPSSEVGVS